MGETVRMTNSSTGGPVFVYVEDGKIVRMTPMDFDDEVDASSWKIEARGRTFTPPRKTTVTPPAGSPADFFSVRIASRARSSVANGRASVPAHASLPAGET